MIRQLLNIIPVRLGRRRQEGQIGKYYVNRRDPLSGIVLLGDVFENVKDRWWLFSRRIPDDAIVLRNSLDRYEGNAVGRPLRRRNRQD